MMGMAERKSLPQLGHSFQTGHLHRQWRILRTKVDCECAITFLVYYPVLSIPRARREGLWRNIDVGKEKA